MATPDAAGHGETTDTDGPGRRQPCEGPAAAALLAAGIGIAVLGLLTTAAAASETVHGWLELSEAVGSLSGKAVFSTTVWLVAWAVMYPPMRKRGMPTSVLVVTGILVLIGLTGTFPPFFEMFAAE